MPEATPAVPAPAPAAPATEAPTAAETVAAVVVAAVPPAAEKPPEPAKPPERDRTVDRLALLTKETQRLAREKQKWAAERQQAEASLKAEREAIAARVAQAEEFAKQRAAALADPESFLSGLYGQDYYDKLTQFRLEGRVPAAMDVARVREEMKAEIERTRKENEQRWNAEAEARRKADEAAHARAVAEEQAIIDRFRNETVAFVKSDPEKYDLINVGEKWDLVFETIEKVYAQTTERDEDGKIVKPGRVLTAAEAADLVEQHLEEEEEKKHSKSKKLAALMARLAQPQPKKEEPTNGQAKTLTNDLGTAGTGPGEKPMDRYARAAAAMEEAMRRTTA